MSAIFETLQQFADIGQALAWQFWLVFLRIGAAMATLPAFGEQAIPQRVKLVITIAFTLVVAPAVVDVPDYNNNALGAMGAEVIIGLAFGLALRLMVIVLQIAGTIAANATTLSQLFGGAGPEPQPAVSNLLVMAGLALALAAGLHVHIASAFIQSYSVFPAGVLPSSQGVTDWGVDKISAAFSLAFVLAAPFTIAAFLYNVALGVINRAMPTLMVSFIGAPALAAGGLALIALATPLMLAVWLTHFQSVLAAPFGVAP